MNPLLTKPSDFKVGQIHKIAPAIRSHVNAPYFVEITEVNKDFIVTNIPKAACHRLWHKTYEWFYHITRMKLIGSLDEQKKLIYKQESIIYPFMYEKCLYEFHGEGLLNEYPKSYTCSGDLRLIHALDDALKNAAMAEKFNGKSGVYEALMSFRNYVKKRHSFSKKILMKLFEKFETQEEYEPMIMDLEI